MQDCHDDVLIEHALRMPGKRRTDTSTGWHCSQDASLMYRAMMKMSSGVIGIIWM